MVQHKRTHEELLTALGDQFEAMSDSCAAYDNGKLWEATRLANCVVNMVYDGRKQTRSILTQLGWRENIEFASYSIPQRPGNLLAWTPLCRLGMGKNGLVYTPSFDLDPSALHRMKFSDWWNEVIFNSRSQNTLSRMELVLFLRNKDNGAHLDAELPDGPYLDLKLDAMDFYAVNQDNSMGPKVSNAHYATMRHIAFELGKSITESFP